MTRLPDYLQPPPAPQTGQPTEAALNFLNDVESALAAAKPEPPAIPTWFRDPTPTPTIGTTPPVAQPGRPPMSQRAVDLNTTILSSSVLTAVLGGSATAIMWASGHANATVIAWICGCAVAVPAAVAIPVLALKGLMKSAKQVAEAAPATHNHHYSGSVYQDHRTTHTETRGFFAKTTNQLPG